MPVEIDALQEWKVGDRMLDDMLRGMTPEGRAAGGVAARHAAAGQARLAQGARRSASRPTLLATAAKRHRTPDRRRTTSTSTGRPGDGVTGTVSPGVRRPAGRGHLLEAGRPTPAGVVDSLGGVDRSVSGPRVGGGVHRAAARRGRSAQGAAARAAGGSRRRAARPRRDVRRGPPRADPVAAQDVLRLGGDRPQPRCPDAGGGLAMEDRPLPRRGPGAAHTSGCGVHGFAARRTWSTAGLPDYATRLWLPMLRAERDPTDGMPPFDLLGPLPTPQSTTVLEASAGTGKTFALAGPGDPVCRRGCGDAGPDAAHHLRPRGQPGTAGAGARSDPRRAAGVRRPDGGRRQPSRHASARRHRPTSWPSASSGCATHWPASTPRPSPPHTSSASWCSNRLVWPVIPMPVFSWSRASTMWSPRSSTTSTWRTSGSRRTIRRSPASEALDLARAGRRQPAHRTAAARPGARLRARGPCRLRESRVRGAGDAQAQARHPALRRSAVPARERAGGRRFAGPGTHAAALVRSSWSTSSRTPTRCSGR